jgi:Rod binding domain-containing protein
MIRGVEALKHISQSDPQKALEGACKEFESIFAHQILKTMGESMNDGFFGEGIASDFYKDMLFRSIASSVAESGSLRIGQIIERHMENLGGQKDPSSRYDQNR